MCRGKQRVTHATAQRGADIRNGHMQRRGGVAGHPVEAYRCALCERHHIGASGDYPDVTAAVERLKTNLAARGPHLLGVVLDLWKPPKYINVPRPTGPRGARSNRRGATLR